MKLKISALLFLISIISAPIAHAENLSGAAKARSDLYDGFKNPPNSARPFVRWDWPAENPTKREINRQLDTYQKAGFGGVEIAPVCDINPKMLKFAVGAAKKRGMLVDLALGSTLSMPNLQSGEQLQIITLGKKSLKGPLSYSGKIQDLIKLADETQNIPQDPNCRVIFLRLVPMGRSEFAPGEELVKNIQPDGSIAFDINDSNDYSLYICVWHENYIKSASTTDPLLDPFNKKVVEKYLNNISSRLGLGKLGDSIRAVSCDALELYGANWTMDLSQQFYNRLGYVIKPYLPLILDFNFPVEQTRFYDTTRRTRYDYCLTLSQLFHENFVETFQGWCRNNGVLSRFQPPAYPLLLDMSDDFNTPDIPAVGSGIRPADSRPDMSKNKSMCWLCHENTALNKIASSAAHFAGKSVVDCQSFVHSENDFNNPRACDDFSFVSGVNHFIFNARDKNPAKWSNFKNISERNARLSYLFQNSHRQARIAIFLPINDIWSDCGPSRGRLADYMWYLFPLWQALSHNGYTTDYIDEKILQDANVVDGKFHCGPNTYDAVILPDAFSIDFLAAKALRFCAQGGGKIIFIGRSPQTAPGFKDLIVRSVPVSITMDYVKQNDPNRVLFLPAPDKNKDNLVTWTADLMKKIDVLPTVKIIPADENIIFIHYLADGGDIFFFTNTGKNSVSFRAQFDTGDKTPSMWDPETGNCSVFPYGDKKDTLNITLQPLKSILLVFEPVSRASSP